MIGHTRSGNSLHVHVVSRVLQLKHCGPLIPLIFHLTIPMLHPLEMDKRVDKISIHDPRLQRRTATINGKAYGIVVSLNDLEGR